MPNNYLSVLYKHIIEVENKNVGLKVCVCVCTNNKALYQAYDWCNKGRECEMTHTKGPLLLIEKSSPCGGSGQMGYFFSVSSKGSFICVISHSRPLLHQSWSTVWNEK